MNDKIAHYINYHPVRTQRGLEILTGLVPWSIIIFLIVGSFFIPEVVAYIVLAFNTYWLYRSLQMTLYAIIGYLNIRATQKIDWLKTLETDEKTKNTFKNYYHIAVICNYKEGLGVIERNLEAIKKQNYPLKNIFIVIAMEKREGEPALERARLIKEKYGKVFGEVLCTFHTLIPGETAGKHSNESYAVKEAKKEILDRKKIPYENVLVTVSDADHVFPDQYFSLLTYKAILAGADQFNFFQAPQFAYNNLHKVPLLVRLPSITGGIYMLSMLQKPSRRFMLSAVYSMPLMLLEKIDYWDLDYIPEDWHLFFKAYFNLGGKVNIIPLYLPISIDAAESATRWGTYNNFYQQLKRWAWGSVDIPYVAKQFFLHPEISFWDKLVRLSLALEWHFVWSSSWFLITFGATIPTILNPVFARTTLGLNLSRMSSSILTICLIGLLTIIVIDNLLNPNKKNKIRDFFHPFTYFQWILLPITGFVFGALPGLESQTRLMLGKYIEYRVTEKVTK